MSTVVLDGVHTKLGYIVRSWSDFVDDCNYSVVTVVIKPHWDLVTDQDVQIDLCTSPTLQDKGGVLVRLVDLNHLQYFPPDRVVRRGSSNRPEIDMPWLTKHHYPLSVWFFSVRLLLRKPKLDPWRASVLVQDFWHVPTDSPPSQWYQNNLHVIPAAGRNKGRRKYMEDVEVVFENIKVNQMVVNVYGVLDGHGGDDCSQHSADDIPMKIAANLRKGLSCPEALFKSFRDTDDEYLRSSRATAGSTANIILFDQSHSTVYVANTGDTRAVLSRNRQAIDLSVDRKATDPEEIARITYAGGFVVNNRVSGMLAITRAIGDGQLKASQKDILIPDPEITFFVPTIADQFVIVATDGLWDVVSSQDAVDYIVANLERSGLSFPSSPTGTAIVLELVIVVLLTSGNGHVEMNSLPSIDEAMLKPKLEKAAMDLVNHAIGLGSADNVTIMLLFLSSPSLDPAALGDYISRSLAALTSGSASRKFEGRASPFELATPAPTPLSTPAVNASQHHVAAVAVSSAPNQRSIVSSAKALQDIDDDDLMSFLRDDKNF